MKSELERLYLDEKLSLRQIAKKLGVSHHTVRAWLKKANIERRQPGEYPKMLVSNEWLREAYLASDLSCSEVARRVGWFNSRGEPDCTRVLKAIGLTPNTTQKTPYQQRFVTEETACLLANALRLPE